MASVKSDFPESDPNNCDPAIDGGDVSLIDNMEDGDNDIMIRGVRSTWIPSNDQTGGCIAAGVTKIPRPRCGSNYAVRLTTAGFSDWGANIGLSLAPRVDDGGTVDAPFDASAFKGVRFWAKGRSGGTAFHLDFKVLDVLGDPSGNMCSPDASVTDSNACYQPFYITKIITDEWSLVTISFDDLKHAAPTGTVDALKVSPSKIYQLLWGLPPIESGDWNQQADLWIDDVGFMEK